jgi:hypothetical protein
MTRVDVSHFNAFCRQIVDQPSVKGMGLKMWDVMLFEVGKVLESCVRMTTEDKFNKIKISVEFKNRTLPFPGETYARHKPIIYMNKRGLIWFYDEVGPGNLGKAQGERNKGKSKTFHPMTEFFHYGNPRWARYLVFLSELKNRKINVRQVLGRAGKSWYQIAQSLGIPIEVSAGVRNAPPFRGRSYVNGRSRKWITANGLFLEIENSAPVLFGTIDGNRILQTAINGRAEYFRRNMRFGVFEDAKEIARAYKSFKFT